MDWNQIEMAFASEAAAHAEAVASIHPYAEAEALQLGSAWVVYSGGLSPVHGVYGLGLDGPLDRADWEEIDSFFEKKERSPSFWITSFTSPEIVEQLEKKYCLTQQIPVHGITLPLKGEKKHSPKTEAALDEQIWCELFSQSHQTLGKLGALAKRYQRQTRFYGNQSDVSLTYFFKTIALVPYPNQNLLAEQQDDAIQWQSSFFAVAGDCPLPLLYERKRYECI